MKFRRWASGETPRTVTFISDLHLYSDRSNYAEHLSAIDEAIRASELCVWGGDLFDFRWTRLGDEATTIASATAWLRDWLVKYPAKQFVFLNGNHDAHGPLRSAVGKLAQLHDNLISDLDVLRIEDCLLLHGDLIEGSGTRESLAAYRSTWERKPVASPIQSRVYDAAIAIRLHKAAASAAHRHRGTCRKLWQSVSRELEGEVDGVRRVVFGHTHRQLRGFRVGDIEFFNGGATVRHVSFAPVRMTFPLAS